MRRIWHVGADPATGEVDRAQVHEALADLESVGQQIGGSFMLVPLREQRGELPSGEPRYACTGWVMEWRSFQPAAEQPAQAPVDEPDGVEDAGAS